MTDKASGRSKPRALTPEIVAESLRAHYGNMSAVGTALGVSRQAIRHYVENHEMCRIAHDEASEVVTDKAEHNIIDAINNGDMKASIYWLRNKARHRGWGDRPALAVNVTPDQLNEMSTDQLEHLAEQLDRAARSR